MTPPLPDPAPTRVPTNLITGFLGAGKTTAIRGLLPRRPANARWSVFVNEYGMVSIDQALLEDGSPDVAVQELGGGCFCCSTALPLGPMLEQFIRATRPDRLLIEPSGAGHPARVIDTLRSGRFAELIDLRATLCLVDPQDFDNPRVVHRDVFNDQIQMADVVVLNWLDRRDPALVARCRQWLEAFDPPKLLVAETRFGALDPKWLDLEGSMVRPPKFPQAHAHLHGIEGIQRQLATPRPGAPLRLENAGQGQWACGWLFAPSDCFVKDELLDLLGWIRPVARLKGVFHCVDDWWQVNRVADECSVALSAYRRDSRLEIICDDGPRDWPLIERQLQACLARE
jgi:G3E family GTPase